MRHVTQSGNVWIISAIAPKRQIWKASQTHEYVAATFYTRPTAADRDKALKDCFAMGTEPCNDLNCDWCNED